MCPHVLLLLSIIVLPLYAETIIPADILEDDFISTRGFAYLTTLFILTILAVAVFYHIADIRRRRQIEREAAQGMYVEWSPLLINNQKNIRPPPPYEQTV
ncbi:unnamed protein product [Caenorhabditis bovis]|uniref:Uncharacterized protein n=1 Tax=Caenorhabditis bovis TaxID=2654633 RepID=A0A8S1EII4_9PELO|nr:unnamed protein product [Caenorhabditis bovis]